MIALAIVSIALVTLLGLANRSIALHERLQRTTQATLLAQGQMAMIESETKDPSIRSEKVGVFDPPFEGYRWRTDYRETPLANVRLVTVTVSWGDDGRREYVDVTSFVTGGEKP